MTASHASPLAELYARIAGALSGRDWYLFGARAAILYGSVRATVDVDIAVQLGDESLDAVVARLGSAGVVPRIADWRALAERARVVLLRDVASDVEVDLVVTGPGLEEEFHARARPHRFGGTMVPVISPEDLIVSKLVAGRPQDLQDIEAVVVAQERLDKARIREIVAMIEAALARADLMPLLERVLAKRR